VRDFASLSARRLDLRMHAKWTLDQDWHIKLPPGTKVKSSTVGGDATSAFGSAKVEVESSPGAIHVHTIITMNTTRVSVADYPAFRAWCADADRLLGQRVLVGK
jgi:hypothetical protein